MDSIGPVSSFDPMPAPPLAGPGLLIIGAPHHGAQADQWLAGMSMRRLGHVGQSDAAERLRQLAGSAIILFFADEHEPMDRQQLLLSRLDQMAALDDIQLIVVTSFSSLEMVVATVDENRVQHLCEPDASDLAVALIVASRMADQAPRLNDIGADGENARIDRLSEEVSRLARTLAAIAPLHLDPRSDPFSAGRMADRASAFHGEDLSLPGAQGAQRLLTAADIREILRARRLRDRHFPGELFADPAWDMLLDLMAARLAGERVSVSSLCIAAAVPPTTALRWIRNLTAQGLFEREADRDDARRIFIRLSEKGARAMEQWFAATHGRLV